MRAPLPLPTLPRLFGLLLLLLLSPGIAGAQYNSSPQVSIYPSEGGSYGGSHPGSVYVSITFCDAMAWLEPGSIRITLNDEPLSLPVHAVWRLECLDAYVAEGTIPLQPGSNWLVAQVANVHGVVSGSSMEYVGTGPENLAPTLTASGGGSAAPGATRSATFQVTNPGTSERSYSLVASSSNESVVGDPADPATLTLAGKQSASVIVTYAVAAGAIAGSTATITLTATDQSDAALSGSASVTHTTSVLLANPDIQGPGNQAVQPNTTNSAWFWVRSNSNTPRTFRFSASSSNTAVVPTPTAPASLPLVAYGNTTVRLDYRSSATNGSSTITLTMTDEGNPSFSSSASFVVTVSNQPPTASFSFSPGSPKLGENVRFTATASDPDGHYPLRYSWSFGDGTWAGDVATADKVFTQARPHSVTLTVTDALGASVSSTQSVLVRGDPTVSAASPAQTANPGETRTVSFSVTNPNYEQRSYSFTATSSNPGAVTIASTNPGAQAIGAGATVPVSVTYTVAAGDTAYSRTSITLTAVDQSDNALSGSASVAHTTNLVLARPIISGPGDQTDRPNGTKWVRFTVHNLSNTRRTFVFAVSSSNTAVIPTPAKPSDLSLRADQLSDVLLEYTPAVANGSSTITLTVTDWAAPSLTNSASFVSTVVNQPPTASFSFSPSSPKVGESVRFTATASDPDGDTPLSYSWYFDDGTYPPGSGAVVDKVFTRPWTYNVTLTVTDARGASTSVARSITVRGGPTVSAASPAQTANPGETRTVSFSVTNPNPGERSYSFAATSSNENVAGVTASPSAQPIAGYATVSVPVTYTVTSSATAYSQATITLRATDTGDSSLSGSASVTHTTNLVLLKPGLLGGGSHTVRPASVNYATFRITNNSNTERTFRFAVRSSNPSVVPTPSAPADLPLGAHGAQMLQLEYSTSAVNSGSSTLTFVVSDRDSPALADSVFLVVTVENQPPTASFSFSPGSPKLGENVRFEATASDPDGDTPLRYSWSFGDGTWAGDVATVDKVFTQARPHSVTLTVTDRLGVSTSVTQTVTVRETQPPTLSPPPPQSADPGETGTLSFSVTNHNAESRSYSFLATSSNGSVVSIAAQPAPQTIATSASVLLTYAVASTAVAGSTAWVRLQAQDAGDVTVSGADSVQLTVRRKVVPPEVRAPASQSARVGQEKADTFTVTNRTNETSTLRFTASSSNAAVVSQFAAIPDQTLGAFQSSPVVVRYTPTATGSATITLTATEGFNGLSGSAAYVTTVAAVNQPPVADFSYMPASPQVGQTVRFTAAASDPDGPPPLRYRWSFGDGTSDTLAVADKVFTQARPYTVTLTVSDGANADTTVTKTVTVLPRPVRVAVTPDGGSLSLTALGGGTVEFQVENKSGATADFDLFAICPDAGVVTSCTPATPTLSGMANGVVLSVRVSFQAVAQGNGRVLLRAVMQGDTTAADTGSVVVTIGPPPPAEVAITQATAHKVLSPNSAGSQVFAIHNRSGTEATYTLTSRCSGVVSCTQAPGTQKIAGGATAEYTVAFQAGSTEGVGQVRLRAEQVGNASVWAEAALTVVVARGDSTGPVVVLDSATAMPLVQRDLCLTIAVGSAAAYECGDLRLAHALPSTRTRNRLQTPVLLYNSQHAEPTPLVSADLGLPVGDPREPVEIEVRLEIVPADTLQPPPSRTWTFPASEWTAGELRRITLPALEAFQLPSATPGQKVYIHDYRLIAVAKYRDAAGVSTRGPETKRSGSFVVVDRRHSFYGAGWWPAGLERLFTLANSSDFLWVGGDGSVRRYKKTSSTPSIWVAPAVERPDTIRKVTITIAGHRATRYLRYLPGNVRVAYSTASGRQIATLNRMDHATLFDYCDSGSLEKISLDVPAGTTRPTYTFTCTTVDSLGSGTRRITAPSTAGQTRQVVATLQNWKVTQIRDADLTTVAFDYQPANGTTTRRITGRQDRRGNWTRYRYDVAQKLDRTTVEMEQASENIVHAFRAKESRGLAESLLSRTLARDSVTTFWDGPRTDAADTTRFWLTPFGGPQVVRNALGHVTELERYDSLSTGSRGYPALVTRVRHPNGFEQTARYNDRGNVTEQTDVQPYGPAQGDAVTTYAYHHSRWPDFVTRLVLPMEEATEFGYDSLGNRTWQQVGLRGRATAYDSLRVDSTRVRFGYQPGTGGQLEKIIYPASGGQTPEESFEYDALGNLSAVVSPKGFRTTYLGDAIGRDTLVRTPTTDSTQLQRQRVLYDAMSRDTLAETLSPTPSGQVAQTLRVRKAFDSEGNLLSLSRSSTPDSANIGTITTRWRYDWANRRVVEVAPDDAVDSTYYDGAGNAREMHTRRVNPSTGARLVITAMYDELNRVTSRMTPEVRYSRVADIGMPGIGTILLRVPAENGPYPRYPNDGGSGYRIPADVATFAYDAMGNDTSATNADARISRRFYLNGLLRTETQRVRTTNESDFTQHVYDVSYIYDLNGRRTEVRHPVQLAPSASQSATRYGYDPVTGALAVVTDALAKQYRYAYNARGEPQSLSYPGGITESYGWDNDGNLSTQQVRNQSGSVYRSADPYLRSTTFRYDARGKLLHAANLYGTRDTLDSRYSGLGHTVGGSVLSHGQGRQGPCLIADLRSITSETIRLDALANTYYSSVGEAITYHCGSGSAVQSGTVSSATFGGEWTYARTVGRLLRRIQNAMKDTLYYDGAGNIELELGQGDIVGNTRPARDRVSYYGADGKLRAAESRSFSPGIVFRGAFEEYRYDAFGRRVWVRARRYCELDLNHVNEECNLDKVRRTVWDRESELYEVQMPGQEGSAYLENDTVSLRLRMELVTPNDVVQVDPNPLYGRVAYTHGLGIDRPLSVLRLGYIDQVDTTNAAVEHRSLPPFTLLPLWNSRGQADLGVFEDGGLRKCEEIGGRKRCVLIGWPGNRFALWRPNFSRSFWHGSVIEDKQDATGTFYRRNRYLHPQTGRFTQEDPLGLAGGLNLYGYAGGDPVNFSDPFGLKVCGRTPSLRRGIERAVNADIEWDEGGCVSSLDDVTFKGGSSWAAVQGAFSGMVTSQDVWTVAPGTRNTISPLGCPQGRCSWFDHDTRTAYIFSADYGPRGATYNRCGIIGWFVNGRYDLPGLIAHELMGHGRWSGTPFASHQSYRLWQAENVYNQSNGRPLVCPRR